MELINKIDLKKLHEEHAKDWWLALESQEGDRAVAIIANGVIDDLLTKLIKAVLIPKSDKLFSNQNILQTTYSKINLAYYLGLIPSVMYKDLMLINKIRNHFAHITKGQMTFENEIIFDLLLKIKLGPRNLGKEKMAKWRFVIAAQQLIDKLLSCWQILKISKIPKLAEMHKFEERNWQNGLTKEEIKKIEKGKHNNWLRITDMTDEDVGFEVFQSGDLIRVDKNCKLNDSDLVVCIIDNKDKLGKIKKIGGVDYVYVDGENIELNNCTILGKIKTQIREFD